MVVATSLWPKSSWMVRMSQPASSACAANAALHPVAVRLVGPAAVAAGPQGFGEAIEELRRSGRRPGKDWAAKPMWSPPDAKRPPGTWRVAGGRAELIVQVAARAGHSSCDPQAPASDRPPLALPQSRGNDLTLVQACRPCQGRRGRTDGAGSGGWRVNPNVRRERVVWLPSLM